MLAIECFGPLIELAGYVFMAVAFLMGAVSAQALAAFLTMAIGLGIALSASALLLDQASFGIYAKTRHLLALSLAVVIENLGYRQLTLLWRVHGLMLWIARRPGRWGEMRRHGTWQKG